MSPGGLDDLALVRVMFSASAALEQKAVAMNRRLERGASIVDTLARWAFPASLAPSL